MKYPKVILAALLLSSASMVYAELVSLSDFEENKVHEMIANGGESLIVDHGEELLGLLYFRPKPTDEELLEASGNPPLLKPRKKDLPVYRAFKSQEEATMDLLKKTSRFKLPEHRSNLEVVSYLIYDVLGEKKAKMFVSEMLAGATAFEKENWETILGMLDDPALKTGHFICDGVFSSPKTKPTISSILKQRDSIGAALDGDEDGSLEEIYRFGRIAKAIRYYIAEHNSLPNTIFDLVSAENISAADLVFESSAGYQVVPQLWFGKIDEIKDDSVVILDFPDCELELRGLIDGTVRILRKLPK